ncbi:APC family permease [Halocalculus aciditolerans]|uniref:Amino acid transporter n=1 Tax=Halocalculus aciditolerans TaxID=1383812 RepID=A0A830FKJ1_9EURY|nr:APC family permease [Halocalculus aciditolerans]GGL55556.1 amino acid transporter [Halocalculus aciditolerans]
MSEKIGFAESVSLAVGGMVGGGIFAVLGVVAEAAGPAAWTSFVVSGVLALCAGYSFVRLIEESDSATAGPVAHVEEFTGEQWLAGVVGWVFTFGYVGTMAMYAYAFGSYGLQLVGVETAFGVAARPFVSVAGVACFVGLNALGARASGRAEDVLVALKVLILLVVGGAGVYYGYTQGTLQSGLHTVGGGVVSAAALSFVAFEGWELLAFDLDSIENPRETVRKAIYASIAFTTLLYVLVAVVTTNLVSADVIRQHAETALAYAARPVFHEAGFALVAVAAVLSTASALNATLFSAARLSQQVADAAHNAPDRAASNAGDGSSDTSRAPALDASVGSSRTASESESSPVRALLVLGVLTAILTAYGSLNSITSFASGAFISIFGAVSAIAYTQRESVVSAVVPAAGAVGSAVALLALFWHLHRTSPDVLATVATIWAVVLAVYWLPRRE